MLPYIIATLVLLAAAAFTVQRTSRTAEKPGRWSRNGLLGIATISTLVMAATLQTNGILAFSILAAWLPGMVIGILLERWHYGLGRRD